MAALLDDISRGVPAIASPHALAVQQELTRIVNQRVRLDPDIVSESIATALTRLERYAQEKRVDPEHAGGLLRVMAVRSAIDFRRKVESQQATERRAAPVEPVAGVDEVVFAMLEEQATSAMVADALRRAMEIGRDDLVRVVRVWLDLADQRSGVPTQRDVAAELGISHTSVRRALSDFAGLLEPPGAMD